MQYYSVNKPIEGELVLVHFTEINDNFISANLIEYNYRGMMKHQDATRKRKVSSWNKIIQLNKNMVARIQEVDNYSNIVQLSLNNLEENNLTFNQIQDKLMVQFHENKIMEGFMKSLCITNQLSYENTWTKLIHYIDNIRREFNDNNDENISIWKYFNDNIDNLNIWTIESGLDDTYTIMIKNLYEKRIEKNKKKIVSKIGIVSPYGITHTKKLLNNVLSTINYNYTLNYDSTPYYLFETTNYDTTIDTHNLFIKLLENESKKMNPVIYIKNDYIAKII